MLLVAASALVGVFLTESQLPQTLAKSIVGITSNPYMVLLLLNVFFLILGMFLHSAAAIILTVPIVMPLVHQVGIDPIHFGLVLTLNLAIGQQTPPVASVLIAACSIAKSDIWETTKANLGFIAVLIGVLDAVQLRAVVLAGADQAVLRQLSARRRNAHRQHARHVQRIALGAVVDLVPARGAVGHDQRIARRLAHRRQQRQFAHLE